MSDYLPRLFNDFKLIEEQIDQYAEKIQKGIYDVSLCRSIYGAFYSLIERYNRKKNEIKNKSVEELRILERTFESDVFITGGLLTLRKIITHISVKGDSEDGIELRTQNRELVYIETCSSAGTILDEDKVYLDGTKNGEPEQIVVCHSNIFEQARGLFDNCFKSIEALRKGKK